MVSRVVCLASRLAQWPLEQHGLDTTYLDIAVLYIIAGTRGTTQFDEPATTAVMQPRTAAAARPIFPHPIPSRRLPSGKQMSSVNPLWAIILASIVTASPVNAGEAGRKPSQGVAADGDWNRFTSARTEASIEIPYHLFPDTVITDITDGHPGSMEHLPIGIRVASMDNNVELAVYGVTHRSDPYSHLCRNGCKGVTYSVKRRNVAVVSGRTDMGIIYYSRCQRFVASKNLHCFELEYPERLSSAVNPVIARMTGSLR